MKAHTHSRTGRSFRTLDEFPDVLSKRPTPQAKPKCEVCSSTYSLRAVEGVTLCRGCRAQLGHKDPPHGSLARYQDGCHCDPCQQEGDRAWARSILRNRDHYDECHVARAERIIAADIRRTHAPV